MILRAYALCVLNLFVTVRPSSAPIAATTVEHDHNHRLSVESRASPDDRYLSLGATCYCRRNECPT